MDKNPLSKSIAMQTTIDNIIGDLCKKHNSNNIEKDVIALFEDIIKFFSGREGDFIDFDSIPMEEKEKIYDEIMIIINLLKKLEDSVDKAATIKILSQNLISTFQKKSKGKLLTSERLSPQEELRLKKEFASLTIQELYKQRQEKLSKSFASKHKDKDLLEIASQVKGMMKSGVKFSDKIERANPKRKKPSIIMRKG